MTTDTPRTDEKEGVYQMRRDVLRPTGIVPADFARTLERDLAAMRERVVKYRARLEIDHHYVCADGKNTERVDLPFDEDEPYDGIECRDTTIRMLDAARDEIRTDLSECRAALAERQVPSVADVIAERQRQINAEGWTPEHDDTHDSGDLATAAVCYALNAVCSIHPLDGTGYDPFADPGGPAWPWDEEWWKPTTPRRDLVKAAALILAEIDRIDRALATKEPQS